MFRKKRDGNSGHNTQQMNLGNNCRLPIADCRLPIEIIASTANKLAIGNWQLAIGNYFPPIQRPASFAVYYALSYHHASF